MPLHLHHSWSASGLHRCWHTTLQGDGQDCQSELKLQVKTHWGTPTIYLPPLLLLLSLLVFISVSLLHCTSLSPSLSTCVKEIRVEYKSTTHHSRK